MRYFIPPCAPPLEANLSRNFETTKHFSRLLFFSPLYYFLLPVFVPFFRCTVSCRSDETWRAPPLGRHTTPPNFRLHKYFGLLVLPFSLLLQSSCFCRLSSCFLLRGSDDCHTGWRRIVHDDDAFGHPISLATMTPARVAVFFSDQLRSTSSTAVFCLLLSSYFVASSRQSSSVFSLSYFVAVTTATRAGVASYTTMTPSATPSAWQRLTPARVAVLFRMLTPGCGPSGGTASRSAPAVRIQNI